MLDAKKDRMDYGILLSPEPGYKLDFAVTTTYSLDLKTLIQVLIPLGLLDASDNKDVYDKVYILRAIKEISDKLIVFSDSSQIKVSKDLKTKSLMLLLEKMILPVNATSNSGHYPSFHPKSWIIKYTKDNEDPIYKFIILSRNLTNDRSWDTAISFVGRYNEQENEPSDNQKAISAFLDYLIDQVKRQKNILNTEDGLASIYTEKLSKLENLQNELKYVEFQIPEGYDFEIIPLGIGNGYDGILQGQLFSKNKDSLTIMSPFVSVDIIKEFEDLISDDERLILITRLQELKKIDNIKTLGKTDLYIIKQEASVENYLMDNEKTDSKSEEMDDFISEDNNIQDIHAKIYVEEIGANTNLYLGSVNASEYALKHNIEMAVKICFKKEDFSKDEFLKDISCGYWFEEDQTLNPFRRVKDDDFKIAETLEQEDQNLSDILKSICRIKSSAKVDEKETGCTLTITFTNVNDCILPGYKVFLSPFGNPSKNTCITNDIIVFNDLQMSQISQLYKIRVESIEKNNHILEKTIVIPTEFNIENRDAAIEKGIFETQDDFCKYISLLLDDDIHQTLREINQRNKNGTGNAALSSSGTFAVYERLLKSSLNKSYFKKAIKEIEELIKNLGDKKEEIVPEEIEQMINIFKQVSGL